MSEFDKDVQCRRNDAIDSAIGFIVSFGFSTTLFVIAVLVEVFGLM